MFQIYIFHCIIISSYIHGILYHTGVIQILSFWSSEKVCTPKISFLIHDKSTVISLHLLSTNWFGTPNGIPFGFKSIEKNSKYPKYFSVGIFFPIPYFFFRYPIWGQLIFVYFRRHSSAWAAKLKQCNLYIGIALQILQFQTMPFIHRHCIFRLIIRADGSLEWRTL